MSKSYVFNTVPMIRRSRSKFNYPPQTVTTTMDVGRLYPLKCQEVYPGDEKHCHSKSVIRLASSFLRPIFGSIQMDTFVFFVPSRLVAEDWGALFGENTKGIWAKTSETRTPCLTQYASNVYGDNSLGASEVHSKSIADYFGLPVGYKPRESDRINVLPFRAFAKIYNDWFMDESTQQPVNIRTDGIYVESKSNGVACEGLNNEEWSVNNYTGKPPFVNKYRDYFTSALPSMQKGQPVRLPLTNDIAPVKTYADSLIPDSGFPSLQYGFNDSQYLNMLSNGMSANMNLLRESNYNYYGVVDLQNSYDSGNTRDVGIYPINLGADLSNVLAPSVAEQRVAFQVQKYLERSARSGTRYTEFIQSAFGIVNPDSRLQRAEFVYGYSTPIHVQQVAQTSATTEDSPLGSLSAYSWSNGEGGFRKAFTEHGFLITCACIRYNHSYQQGIHPMWLRSNFTDYYDPLFQNISEQPIYESELYAKGTLDPRDKVFGYKEAWTELRYEPSYITGQMRNGVDNSQSIWQCADYYANTPTLTHDFIKESRDPLARTVSVTSSDVDMFIVQYGENQSWIRELCVYSTPGLIDHH